jgi:hypothetical protein
MMEWDGMSKLQTSGDALRPPKDDKVVVEVKAIEKFSDANFAQLNSYLHFSSFEVGLLINFHNWPLKDGGIKRLINTKP